MKSEYWNSAIGRHPSIAAPTANPTIVSSAIGVSITRPGPNPPRNPPANLNAPPHRAADRDPHDRPLCDRRAHRAAGADPLEDPLGHLERPAVDADVLAEHDHALVALHLFPQRLRDGDQVGRLAVLGALAPRFGAVARSAGLDRRARHQPASVPPPRPASDVQ